MPITSRRSLAARHEISGNDPHTRFARLRPPLCASAARRGRRPSDRAGDGPPNWFLGGGPRPRTIQYPFTVIQMQIGRDGKGKGKGTLSVATKIVAHKNVVELENFATQPVMLTEITSKTAKP